MRETTMIGLRCSMQYFMDIRSLLKCYLNAGQQSKHGVFSAPLHCTRRYEGKVQAARFLLEHGADVNARDNRGWTPSRWKSTEEIVKLLAEDGAETG
jgi:ankyrin repeat protein